MILKKVKPIRLKLDDLKYAWDVRVNINKDAHIALSGDEGEGKSTLALQILRAYKVDKNLWVNVVYTDNPDEFFDKYEQLEEKQPMVLDEALGLINRMKWYDQSVQELVQKFREGVRKEKNPIFIYNVQLFRDLHNYWRNHRIRYWIELMPREWFKGNVNWGFVLKRQRVPFITGKRDAWLLDEVEKEWIKKMQKGEILGKDYMNMLRAHPFYVGEFKFKEVPPTLYKRYLKRREEAIEEYKKKVVDKNITETKKQLELAIKLGKLLHLLNKGVMKEKYSITELAQMLKINPQTASKYIKYYYAYSEIEDM